MKPGRVVVIGGGIAPAMTAIALRRAFARAGIIVEWVETPHTMAADRALVALPNLQAFHALLGIEEPALLRAADAAFTLGQQYLGFAGEPGGFLHSYGPVGRPFANLPFVQFWVKAKRAGLPAGFDDFSRESTAARNGRMRIAGTSVGEATAHGMHLDARSYAALLRDTAIRAGVSITPDPAPVAETKGGAIREIRVSGGRVVAGDLFVDCTPDAAIRSTIDADTPVETRLSGCDRIMFGSARVLRPLPLYSRVTAHGAGWSALYPLRGRTGIAVAYDSARVADTDAPALAGMPLEGPPEYAPIDAARLAEPWCGNVVAIGDGAARFEPLAGTELHRLQIAITHLVSLFPVRADVMVEAGIYNEELTAWHARLDDFTAAHYALNRRAEPFWQEARARPVSRELRARIDLFAARAMIAQFNQESMADDEWQSCFLGHGLMPRSYDPQVDRVDEQQVMADFRAQLAAIRQDVMAMEPHEAALARVIGR